MASTDLLSPNARRAIDIQDAGVLLRSDLQELPIEWPDRLEELQWLGADKATTPISPWPHQLRAVEEAAAALRAGPRGQVIMPCGTGKTHVGLWLAERLKAERVLFPAPSLALVGRTLEDWTAHAAKPLRWIAVCSDQTVSDDAGHQTNDQDSLEMVADLRVRVTTDPKAIAAFLAGSGSRVVFATYQSSSRIAEAMSEESIAAFDVVVCDEAHRLAGVANRDCGAVLAEDRIPANRRVFVTATPRTYSPRLKAMAAEADVLVASMDDESVFGPVVHELSFARAIEDDLLADYRSSSSAFSMIGTPGCLRWSLGLLPVLLAGSEPVELVSHPVWTGPGRSALVPVVSSSETSRCAINDEEPHELPVGERVRTSGGSNELDGLQRRMPERYEGSSYQ